MLTSQNPDPTAQKPFLLLRPFVSAWQWLVPPSQAHADRQSRASRFIAASLIIAICLGVVILVLVNGRSWKRTIQTWRSDILVAKSKKIQATNPKEALNEANQACILAPDNPNAVRHLARYATEMRRQEAAYLWKHLEQLGMMTDDDVDWSVSALANLHNDQDALTQIDDLLSRRPPTAQLVQTADTVLQRLGRFSRLIEILSKYAKQRPDDLKLKGLLAARMVQYGTPAEAVTGIKSLWEVAEDNKEPGLRALEFLYRLKLDDEADQTRLIERLEHHPNASEQDRIAAIRRLAELHPERKAELINKAIQDRRNAPREALPPLLKWLNDEHEYERVIALLKPREALIQGYEPILTNYLNALTLTERYQDLERLVNDPKSIMSRVDRSMHLMHLGYVLHKEDTEKLKGLMAAARDAVMSDAADRDKSQAEKLFVIAHYAMERGLLDEARKSYHAASLVRVVEREGFEGELQVSYQMGDSTAYVETAAEMVRRWPDNKSYLERYLYGCLLTGERMETSIAQAAKLLEARPRDSRRKLLMAMAYYRMSDPEETIRVMENTSLEEFDNFGEVAVFCGLLRGSFDRYAKQAQNLAAKVPDKTLLLPEEQKFLDLAKR